MKLNPLKCAIGVELGKFLGFMVNQHGIEAIPEKINALLDMSSPRKPKEVMSLAGRMATLSHFVSRATDCCALFLDMLKGSKKFQWTETCEQQFLALKEHLGCPLLLSKPIEGENLFLYLTISEEVVNATLVRKEEKVQWSVYYVSKRLLDAETRYLKLNKLALALIVASRKLTSYFHVHPIEVFTNYPLCQVLQKLAFSGRLLKWAIELGQFKVNFHSRTTIKGQAIVNCITEFTYSNTVEVTGMTNSTEIVKAAGVKEKENSVPVEGDAEQWTPYVDGTSNDIGSRASMMLISPKGHKIHYAICFGFKASNNEAEYEALIASISLAREL